MDAMSDMPAAQQDAVRLPDARAALARWRHLIEPTVAASLTPMPWADVLRQPARVFEGARSVMVTRRGSALGEPACVIWVAAGDLTEMGELYERVKRQAAADGCPRVIYMGRRGWLRAFGLREAATVGVFDLPDLGAQ
ncbi:MAG TPA: hypothetical protein DCM32_08070 [Xanthomonadaceae bacterium]|jgi:hypothetical protein|nr:hypothetical protein [Xanthomonadaceae bacterium]